MANSSTHELAARLLLCLVALHWFAMTAHTETRLPRVEVSALRDIARKLGKKDWDFSVDPCSGDGNWTRPEAEKGFESYVTCNCSFNSNKTCHIDNLVLKAENLTGILPPEISRLRHLRQVDLSRNVLHGTVPPQWATTRLLYLSLMSNNLSGPFPTVVTKITSLQNLSLEGNRFSGAIPSEIGRLAYLQKLVLSANEFTGQLPKSMANFNNLSDLRISGNDFNGRIPEIISKWTQLEKLHIEGCPFEGPIPSGISALTKLKDLRISDIHGKGDFPNLSKMKSLKILILRKCSLQGNLPEHLGKLKKIKTFDVSFNDLVGEIPITYSSHIAKADFMYLTGNMLTGTIPEWVLKSNKNVDISQNNFTWENSSPTVCPQGSVNLVESYALISKKGTGAHPCLERSFPCLAAKKQQRYSLHINCGGKELLINGTKYEADLEARGASMFYSSQNWAFSSTGNFMDNDMDADIFIARNSSKILMPDSELYTTGRISPLSLTYYGLCLMNGNYTVKLHFAELIFSDDHTFRSLGRRIFDVYIQGKLVLKDFNIEDEAKGTGRAVVKNFNASVTSSTLMISFHWAGKGTTGIPSRGVYGPLVSAISVDPNFEPPLYDDKKKLVRILVQVLAPATFIVLAVLSILWWKCCFRSNSMKKKLEGLDLQIGIFPLRQIKAATKNFDPANKLGEGGFGPVYKGMLSDGTFIAVKLLSSKSKQGNREFVNEIGMISTLQHPNLVKLHGCCVEGHQLLLIYEYMENNCLSKALFGTEQRRRIKLDWPTRMKICLGIAKGLAYLHEESRLKIVHRDIKTSNVLLDKKLNAKISDFGLAKLVEEDKTHISTRIAGTIGYMAPEYAMRGYLTDKADVYSFGVVALETVSGKSNTNYRPEEFVYLLDWAYVLQERGNLLDMMDPNLGAEYSTEEALLMLNVALLCTSASPTLRPTMSAVVSMIEGRVQPPMFDREISSGRSGFRSNRSNFWQCPSPISAEVPSTKSLVSSLEMQQSEAEQSLISERSVRRT